MASEVFSAREGGVQSLNTQNAVNNSERRRYNDLSWDEKVYHAGTYMPNARRIVSEQLQGVSHAKSANGSTSSNGWQLTPNRSIWLSEATNYDGTMGYKLEVKNSKGKVIRKMYPYNERQLRIGTGNVRRLIETKRL